MVELALKKGWTRVAFGDVARLSGERSSSPEDDGFEHFVGLDHMDPGDLRIRRWGNTADGSTFTSVFRPGQVLFGKRRAYQRKVAVADFSGVCSGDIYVLQPRNALLLPELLPFICQTEGFFEHAVGTSAGSLSPRTNWNSLASYEFALPPLDEQARYARVLRAVDEATSSCRHVAQCVEHSRESLLRSHFEARSSWSTKHIPLAQLAAKRPHTFGNGPFGSDLLTSELRSDSGVPVIYVRDIVDGVYTKQQAVFVTEAKAQALAAARVISGDLLIAKVGDPPGVSALYPVGEPDAIVTQDVIRIRADDSTTSAAYLRAFLNSAVGARAVAALSVEGTRRRIGTGDLKALRCPVPTRSEQAAILDILAQLDAAEHAVVQRQITLRALKKRLMHSLLSALT